MNTNQPSHTALLQRPVSSPVAHLTVALNKLEVGEQGLEVSQNQFLNHVHNVAAALPDHQNAVNLCDNRYLFLVTLCAVIVRGGTNLLPPNKNASTQTMLGERYSNCILIHDGAPEIADGIEQVDISTLDWSLDDTQRAVPLISSDHCAAISFTSGSTGQSKPNIKYWRTLVQSSKINARYMLVDEEHCHHHLATVPGQHMWGFETSVLLPMFANACLVDTRPFFPHDIIRLIQRLPAPCTLISAPLHLKTLSTTLSSNHSEALKLASILCATAPLDDELAGTLEQQTTSQLREVYGCSEVGSMAVRQTAREQRWTPFSGLNFHASADSQTAAGSAQNSTTVSADHLPDSVTLEDTLIFNESGSFSLAGRHSDQIKIAGKRGSLTEVNSLLNKFAGVKDGVVIFPEQTRAVPRLVAIVVLDDGVSKADLRTYMAKYLDAAFVPRPILQTQQLPREENGKLSKAKVLALYRQLSNL